MDKREELYGNWLEWVTTNLGRDPRLAGVAATAATDAVERGAGFNSATQAATAAWNEAGGRPGAGHPRPDRVATVACASGIALWMWLILTPVLLIASASGADGLAGFAAVMSIAGLVAVPVFFLGSIVCGHWALTRTGRSGARGKGYALTGLILGYAALPVGLVGFVVMSFFATMYSCYAVMC